MLLIDANTGEEITEWSEWANVNGRKWCLYIRPGLFTAKIGYTDLDRDAFHELTVPIRFLHPQFLFRRVAFFPS